MSNSVRCLAGRLGLVAGLSLILLGGCEKSHPTSSPVDSRTTAVTPQQPGTGVSPKPTAIPGVPMPPRTLPGGGQPPGSGSGGGGGSTLTIEIESTSYSPDPASVKTGQAIRWHNGDTEVHTATSTTGEFDMQVLPDQTSSEITINHAGTISYRCTEHPGHTGSLNVTAPSGVR